MHTNDKNAPKMGTLLYRVNETDKPPIEVTQYVVAYDGTEVCIVMLNSPTFRVKYEPGNLATSIKDAYTQAADRCVTKASALTALAEQFRNKAEEIK